MALVIGVAGGIGSITGNSGSGSHEVAVAAAKPDMCSVVAQLASDTGSHNASIGAAIGCRPAQARH